MKRPFGNADSMARLKRIKADELEARRLRRALEAIVRLHAEADDYLIGRKAELFDPAAATARDALEHDTKGTCHDDYSDTKRTAI